MAADFSNPYYPYEKTKLGFNSFRGTEKIPHMIINYLLDLPDANGYEPIDDNSRPRVRLAKWLWYDGVNPLGNALPTPEQKLSMLFDGEHPVLNTDEEKAAHPKGYRVFSVPFVAQSNDEANAILKCSIGRTIPISPFAERIGISFEIVVSYNVANVSKTDDYDRAYAIEQCIKEALHGVNITGVGEIGYDTRAYSPSGSIAYRDRDDSYHSYRVLNMFVNWQESDMGKVETYEE